jgi:hypothetical protein
VAQQYCAWLAKPSLEALRTRLILQCNKRFRRQFGARILKELSMSVLSKPVEASTRLGSYIVEGLTGVLIVLSAVLALATVAVVA